VEHVYEEDMQQEEQEPDEEAQPLKIQDQESGIWLTTEEMVSPQQNPPP
jgi:hypothetical protein